MIRDIGTGVLRESTVRGRRRGRGPRLQAQAAEGHWQQRKLGPQDTAPRGAGGGARCRHLGVGRGLWLCWDRVLCPGHLVCGTLSPGS